MITTVSPCARCSSSLGPKGPWSLHTRADGRGSRWSAHSEARTNDLEARAAGSNYRRGPLIRAGVGRRMLRFEPRYRASLWSAPQRHFWGGAGRFASPEVGFDHTSVSFARTSAPTGRDADRFAQGARVQGRGARGSNPTFSCTGAVRRPLGGHLSPVEGRSPNCPNGWIYKCASVYTRSMGKHLVDLDDDALNAARAELGTTTIKDTVNEALRRATAERARRISDALDVLAKARLDDRAEAWR